MIIRALATSLTVSQYGVISLVIVAKMLLAALMPVTGDEAYFVQWGYHPALGYYDHPPLTGWWLSLMLPVSDHPLIIRCAAIAVSLLPAYVVYRSFKSEPELRWSATIIALFIPSFMVNVFYTTDTWLIGFGIAAMWVYTKAVAQNCRSLYLLTGVFLALAFLSKYLAVLIGVAILVDQVIRREPRGLVNLSLILVPVVPAAALNISWNLNHCGYNILFNFVNRQTDAQWDVSGMLTFSAMLGYVMTPWLMVGTWKYGLKSVGDTGSQSSVWRNLLAVPVCIFLVVALIKPVGLHWVVPAIFCFLMVAGFHLWPAQWLRRAAWATAAFGVAHWALLMVIATVPIERWLMPDRSERIGFYRFGPQIAEAINEQYDTSWVIASPSYSRAAVMSYHIQREVPVIGAGSRYGRQSDLIHSLYSLDGRNFVVVSQNGSEVERFRSFFDSSDVKTLQINNSLSVAVLQGVGFRADKYSAETIPEVVDRFYQIPEWLPVLACKFSDKPL